MTIRYLLHITPYPGSLNLGDLIIEESVHRYLRKVLPNDKNYYIIKASRNLPLSKKIRRLLKKHEDSLVVVSGTNLFHMRYTPFSAFNESWILGLSDLGALKEKVVFFGVGTQEFGDGMTFGSKPKSVLVDLMRKYSERMWKKILNRDWIHITRDRASKELLEKMGYRAVNLGCPTLWPLVENEIFGRIPETKSDIVVTTLTDYGADLSNDMKMLSVLGENYDEIYFWPQGSRDWEYLDHLERAMRSKEGSPVKIKRMRPTLEDYDRFLSTVPADYVGTRLHGGIRALQHGRRAIIIGIDNRAISMRDEFGLPVLDRKDISSRLEEAIHSKQKFTIKLRRDLLTRYLNEWSNLFDY